MDRTDRLSLNYVMAAQAQKHVTVNETTRAVDALLHMSVNSRSVAAETTAPTAGEGYILPVGKTGALWSNFADHAVVVFQDNAWMEFPPVIGMTVYVADEHAHLVWDGAAWDGVNAGAASEAPIFGVNASADATNKLAVKSDAILFSHDDVTPGSGDLRAVINKQSEANTASLVFQDGFSARAEFGLTGTDDFVIKVSPDGQTFFDALIIDRTTGAVSFPNSNINSDPPVSFAPSDIDGLVGWYDPSDSGTMSVDGSGRVSAMTNKVSGSDDAVQLQAAAQPTLGGSVLGGRDALVFSGAEFLELNGLASQLGGDDQPFSVHLIMRAGQTGATEVAFGMGHSGTNTRGVWFGPHSSDVFRISKRSAGTVDRNITDTDEAPHFVSIVHTGTATTVWVDGLRIFDGDAQNVGPMDVNQVTLGAWARIAADFFFRGEIGEVLLYNRAVTPTEVKAIQRYLGERWFDVPASADVFLALGQSNMMGKGDGTTSPTVETGVGFEWTADGHFQAMDDPVGPADTGSALPAFANGWHAATGRAALILNKAKGSTALLPEADSGVGNWNKTQGTLYNAAVADGNSALAQLTDGSIYDLGGVYALWAQGERDADNVHIGTPGVTGTTYANALATLVSDLATDLTSGLDGFFVFELGARTDGSQAAAWADIRAAQATVATNMSTVAMVFTGAKDFPAQGLMADDVHYTQAGYNQMGTDGAAAAAALV